MISQCEMTESFLVNVTAPAISTGFDDTLILIGSYFFFANRDMEVETRSSVKREGKKQCKQ